MGTMHEFLTHEPHMNPTLLNALHFDSSTRLYRMQAEGEMSELMVEAWSLQEELSSRGRSSSAPWA